MWGLQALAFGAREGDVKPVAVVPVSGLRHPYHHDAALISGRYESGQALRERISGLQDNDELTVMIDDAIRNPREGDRLAAELSASYAALKYTLPISQMIGRNFRREYGEPDYISFLFKLDRYVRSIGHEMPYLAIGVNRNRVFAKGKGICHKIQIAKIYQIKGAEGIHVPHSQHANVYYWISFSDLTKRS